MLPIILLIPFLIMGCLWAPLIIRRLGLIGGALAVMLFGACFGYEFFHVSVITSDRLLIGGLVVMYLLQRNFHGLRGRRVTRTDGVLLAFYAAIAAVTLKSDWRWNGGQPVSVLLFFYILPLIMYWIVSRCELTETAFKWTLGFFVLFGCYLTCIGVLEVAGIHGPVFPRYIVNSGTIEFLGRARGPFLNPIGNGMYLTMGVISSLLLWPHVHKYHRPALVPISAFLCFGALLTLTRSVWLGVIAAIFTLAVIAVPKRHRVRVVLCATILGVVGLAVAGSSAMSFKRDKNLSAAEAAESVKLRPILAAFAWEMFKDRPLTGVGLSQYRRHNLEYLTQRSFDLPLVKAKTYVQHNVFLSLLVETGLIGLSLFCLVLMVWAWNAWTLWHAENLALWQRQVGLVCLAMLASYFPNGMFHEMSVIPMQNILLFFVGGLCRNVLEALTAPAPAFGRRATDGIERCRASDLQVG